MLPCERFRHGGSVRIAAYRTRTRRREALFGILIMSFQGFFFCPFQVFLLGGLDTSHSIQLPT